jgi:soluble lytic murein transglycosylase
VLQGCAGAEAGVEHSMRIVSFRVFSALLLFATVRPALADDPMALVHADRWADADAAVADDPDPVARKLITYFRLLAPGAATAAEIGAFLATSPDWPLQGTLAKRRDEALATEPDDAVAAGQCDSGAADDAAGLARCADAAANLGHAADAAGYARRAWVALGSDPAQEDKLLARWSAAIGRAEQWQRFDRLAWTDTAGATRQAARLDGSDRARAEARLALRRDDVQALALTEQLPAAERGDPTLVLEQARYLRRANLDAEALKLWSDAGDAAERAAPAEHLTAFWDERNILARRRLRDGDAAGAYALASMHAQHTAEQVADAEFLAGFIALRKLNDAAGATQHFSVLAEMSRATITQARAHFWLARAAGDEAAARREYQAAAAYPSTFYGQLAALALGDGPAGLAARITALRDPAWDSGQALDFAGRELARASAYLVGWGDAHRAQGFLLRLADIAPDPVDRSIAARLAGGFGMPETAIALARRAGRDGVILLDAGWPLAAEMPPGSGVEPALALGIVRQESSFDTTTVSPAGARGLMQLMPATAAQVAKLIGMRTPLPSLTGDPTANLQLGTAYLRSLLDQYDGCIPLAVAAYNAGPTRAGEWLGTSGDPRNGSVEMLDWIEQIPFGETRNYVQRVIENTVVYRAKRGDTQPHPLAQWLR